MKSRLKFILTTAAIAALLALSPAGSRSASAHGSGGNQGGGGNRGEGNGGGPYQAPELNVATAAQGLILIGGTLVLMRRYRRQS